MLILLLGGFFVGIHTAQAGNGLLRQYPYVPPDDDLDPRRNRPPWREPTPKLKDVSLPDLQTLPPFDLQLVVHRGSGRRVIRFSNSVWNSGPGVLELRGIYNQQNNTIEVRQYLYGFEPDLVKRRVNEFMFHREHNHWHWDGFSIYEIWTVESNGRLGEIVVTSGKVGYCMLDINPVGDDWIQKEDMQGLEIPDRRQYGDCGWRRQGISVGWVDTYDSDTPGQAMDVSDLPDGLYALRSTVDPDGILYESNITNNSAVVFFSMRGDHLHVIGEALTHHLLSPLIE